MLFEKEAVEAEVVRVTSSSNILWLDHSAIRSQVWKPGFPSLFLLLCLFHFTLLCFLYDMFQLTVPITKASPSLSISSLLILNFGIKLHFQSVKKKKAIFSDSLEFCGLHLAKLVSRLTLVTHTSTVLSFDILVNFPKKQPKCNHFLSLMEKVCFIFNKWLLSQPIIKCSFQLNLFFLWIS